MTHLVSKANYKEQPITGKEEFQPTGKRSFLSISMRYRNIMIADANQLKMQAI
ncbi:MAG: hypothetical protein JKY95_16405 [Planctomycetaceae bacterium]|nr:hypothetical protein [Planctomycetaceae bacterium]